MAYVPSTLVLAKFCIVPHQRSRSAIRNKSIILQNEMLSYVTTTAVLVSYSGHSTDVRSCIRTNFCSVNRSLQFDPIRQVLDKVDKVFPKQKFFARRTSSGRSDFLIYSKNILAQQLFQTRQLFHINIIMYPFEIRPNILRNFGQHSVSFKNY